MKRILIFSLAYYPQVGGAEVALKEIADRISDIEFHLVTLNFGKEAREEKIGNIFVHRVGGGASYLSKILFIPRAAYAARGMNRIYHFDALWAMMSYMLFPIVLANLGLPYVLTLQEGDPFKHAFNRWFILPFRPLLARGFRQASAVTAISTYLAGWASRMGFAGEVNIIPNGADVKRFAGPPMMHPGIVLITASRLVTKNAVDDIIRALPLIPEARLRICGEGPEEANLRSLARTLGVSHSVDFEGQVSHDRLPEALRSADIFVRASRSEGMGNAFIEAMAAGLPVIGTQEGGIADFLFDAKRNPDKPPTGFAVDPDSPHRIAEAVRYILAHPSEAARAKVNALALVKERYDWPLISSQMRDILIEL